MSTTNANHLCINCMREKADDGVCPFCGFDESQYEPSPHHLQPRSILGGKCLIGRVLGEGGFGITYIGLDLNLELKLAIKEYYPTGYVTRTNTTTSTVTPYRGEKADFFVAGRSRFINEAKTLARFYTLPGIVSVRDFFLENGTAYIVMEFVEGETLKQRLARVDGKMEASDVFELVRPLLRSLAEMHASGLIHRDISPDNIMITPEGNIKLIDFGAARDYLDSGNRSLSVMLKPGFAPQEQYFSRGEQGPWTDIYALCATIYRAITGITPPESVERLRRDELKAPSALGIAISPAQEAALLKGLAVSQEERWQSIPELDRVLFSGNNAYVPSKPVVTKKPSSRSTASNSGGAIGSPGLLKKLQGVWSAVVEKHTLPKIAIPVGIAVVLVLALVIPWSGGKSGEDGRGSSKSLIETILADFAPLELPERISVSNQDTMFQQAVTLIKQNKLAEAKALYDFSRRISAEFGTGILLSDNTLRISRERKVKDDIDTDDFGTGVAITMGGHAILHEDGTVFWDDGETPWNDIVSIAGYDTHLLGLKSDGSVVVSTWLSNDHPYLHVSGWMDIVSIAAGYDSSVGLKSDGTVVEEGVNKHGEGAANQWTNIAAISAGTWLVAGLKTDGTVITTNPTQFDTSSWNHIVAITAGQEHLVGLKADGTVVAVGSNDSGECMTTNWKNIIAISAGTNFTVALQSDGTILAIGNNDHDRYGLVQGVKIW